MKYIKAILFILSFTIAFAFFSCEKGTEPDQLKPGRRDYTWTVDTIKTFNTPLMKMWGSSPTDIWAVGSGSSSDQTIWRYDGTEWKTDNISRAINPWCIHGFAENDVWIGGEDGEIWHYDGSDWSESLSYSKQLKYHYYNIYFMDIWGEKPNDIYAVGFADSSNVGLGDVRFGIMLHYDGNDWGRVNIEFIDNAFMKIRKGINDNNYFIWSYISSQTYSDSAKYYKFDGKNLHEIYYSNSGSNNWHDITVIKEEVIFTIGDGIYTYSKNKFNLIVENPYTTNYESVYGRNKKDIIWMMADGLTHYNGTNFEYILNFERKSLSDGFVFENEVFFVASDFYNNDANNIIYHGVLNKEN
ncbi:MAG: hypothetical protein KKF62_02125 [Bacteroidetes bacterium]|nr:hypothetical protein [Bacteroidota bacterium]MBU1114571.1 hypothetical protein [Bacteroidota bacterium]MBU1798800.1 hypothetical protein [Bacteroidota bacterium]